MNAQPIEGIQIIPDDRAWAYLETLDSAFFNHNP
jgi:hypothetical protein